MCTEFRTLLLWLQLGLQGQTRASKFSEKQRERKSSSILYLKCALPVSKISKDLPLNATRDSPVNFLENELGTNL